MLSNCQGGKAEFFIYSTIKIFIWYHLFRDIHVFTSLTCLSIARLCHISAHTVSLQLILEKRESSSLCQGAEGLTDYSGKIGIEYSNSSIDQFLYTSKSDLLELIGC